MEQQCQHYQVLFFTDTPYQHNQSSLDIHPLLTKHHDGFYYYFNSNVHISSCKGMHFQTYGIFLCRYRLSFERVCQVPLPMIQIMTFMYSTLHRHPSIFLRMRLFDGRNLSESRGSVVSIYSNITILFHWYMIMTLL